MKNNSAMMQSLQKEINTHKQELNNLKTQINKLGVDPKKIWFININHYKIV